MTTAKRKLIVLIAAVLVLLVLIFPYIKTEYLTHKYGDEFAGLEKQTSMLSDSDYHKVISRSSDEAVVLYVSKPSKDEIVFTKDSFGLWTVKSWRTIWSEYGSADEFYWPFYK